MEAPRTPAQWYAGVVAIVLLVFGLLAYVITTAPFGTVDEAGAEEFILWPVSAWDTVIYLGFGALGLLLMSTVHTARAYCLLAGAFFAAVAVWGFIDGDAVFSVMAVDTTDNISHAVIGALGLIIGLIPGTAQREAGLGGRHPHHGPA
jgi:Domain of unknown function (DUF4383)